jgi:hypothetical protein
MPSNAPNPFSSGSATLNASPILQQFARLLANFRNEPLARDIRPRPASIPLL